MKIKFFLFFWLFPFVFCKPKTGGTWSLTEVSPGKFTREMPTLIIMSLNNIVAFDGKRIDISVLRSGGKIKVDFVSNGKNVKSVLVRDGCKIEVKVD